MNLVSGLEEVPGYFWYVSAGSIGWAVAVYASLVAFYTRPLRSTQHRLADITALQDLLMYNVDVIGEVCSVAVIVAGELYDMAQLPLSEKPTRSMCLAMSGFLAISLLTRTAVMRSW
jgi:hypothetical protein